MVADASIYSMIRPAQQVEGPVDQFGKMLTLKSLIGQNELSDLQRQKLVSDMAEEQAFKEALRSPTINIADLFRASPTRAVAYQKADLETKKTNAEIQQKQVETFAKSMAMVNERLKTVRDEPSYQAAREYATSVLGPDLVAKAGMPANYDPEFVKRTVLKGDEFLAPKPKEINLGGKTVVIDTNPFTNPKVLGMDLPQTPNPEAVLADRRARDVSLASSVAEAKEIGEAKGKAKIALPQAIDSAERGLRLIDELVKHPGLSSAVGGTLTPGARFIPGTRAADFQARLDEIKGGAFMEAFQSLRGGGQITEKEGEKATAAITRMSLSQSEVEFKKAAKELQDVIRTGLARAQQRAGASRGGASGSFAPSGIKFLGFE